MLRLRLLFCTFLLSMFAAAADPVAAISASPAQGNAPLPVFFDGSASSVDAVNFLWEFGDGAVSTAKTVTHIYNVAGIYTAFLTVTNGEGFSDFSQVQIIVAGSGEGPLTGNMNFRVAPKSAGFKLNFKKPNADSFVLSAGFNTVDLPDGLRGIAASFTINGLFSFNGILDERGVFQSPDRRKPFLSLHVDQINQQLDVIITKANLGQAFAASGVTGAGVPRPGDLLPVEMTLTVGAQTYSIIENFQYTASAGSRGTGTFNLRKAAGTILDGFFVITQASALESLNGKSHFYEFNGLISRPASLVLQQPGSGTYTFTFNDADKIVVPFDRIKFSRGSILISQRERDLGGVRKLLINLETRIFLLRTWDIERRVEEGGTGMPVRGQPFEGFNFTLRLDLDQSDGTTFQVVTATRFTRRDINDAFWQTGRKRKKQ